MNSICIAPPRYQLPCSQYGPTLPTPAPKPCTFIAAKPGMAERRDRGLPLRGRRAPGRAELAVRPRLLGQVVDRFVAVGDRRAENVVVAFGEEMAALVLPDVGVAALDGLDDPRHVGGHAVADVPEVEVVRRLDEDDRHLAAPRSSDGRCRSRAGRRPSSGSSRAVRRRRSYCSSASRSLRRCCSAGVAWLAAPEGKAMKEEGSVSTAQKRERFTADCMIASVRRWRRASISSRGISIRFRRIAAASRWSTSLITFRRRHCLLFRAPPASGRVVVHHQQAAGGRQPGRPSRLDVPRARQHSGLQCSGVEPPLRARIVEILAK